MPALKRVGVEGQKRNDEMQVVELDRPLLAVLLLQRQAHRDPHPEASAAARGGAAVVDQVAVVERLQAEVLEGEIALRRQRRAEPLEVEVEQLGRQQLQLHRRAAM